MNMLEKHIREACLEYLNASNLTHLDSRAVITKLESHIPRDILNVLLEIVVIYHTRTHDTVSFVLKNRHNLFPDTLSDIIESEHDVLEYILGTDKADLSGLQGEIRHFLASVKKSTEVNYEESSQQEFNEKYGSLTVKSENELNIVEQSIRLPLCRKLNNSTNLFKLYGTTLGRLPVLLYLCANRIGNNPIHNKTLLKLNKKNLARDINLTGMNKMAIRPWVSFIAKASESPRLIAEFDKTPYTLSLQKKLLFTLIAIHSLASNRMLS